MKRFLIELIKYYPIIINLWILVIMSGSLLGYKYEVINSLYTYLGQSFLSNLIILLLSYHFKFCHWHRVLIGSMTFVLLLETVYNYGLVINNFQYVSVSTIILSLIVSTFLLNEYGCFQRK